jgi:hypothetical protein
MQTPDGTEQRIANRAWLMEYRRWVRSVEVTHQRRQMMPRQGWRWLYEGGSNATMDMGRRDPAGDRRDV